MRVEVSFQASADEIEHFKYWFPRSIAYAFERDVDFEVKVNGEQIVWPINEIG